MHGARALGAVSRGQEGGLWAWVNALLARRPYNVVVAAHGTGAIRQRLPAPAPGRARALSPPPPAPERRLAFVLQQRAVLFYALLGDALAAAARGRPRVVFLDDLAPESVAGR